MTYAKPLPRKQFIVLDNAPIHRSKLFKSKIKQWQEQDLFMFFLPTYSPELKKIEILWRLLFVNFKIINSLNREDAIPVSDSYSVILPRFF